MLPDRKERLAASTLLSLAILIFLSPAFIPGGYYSPADLLWRLGLFTGSGVPHNPLLSDVVLQMHPWARLSAEIFSSGSFPLWNIFSGGGLPLFANMQSAVLYPANYCFYILPFPVALLVCCFVKLFAIGFFSYLYFREIQARPWIALAGALAFQFAGFNVVWLMWPHTNVVFLLPCGLFLTERYFRTGQPKYLLWFSVALAVALFGGHPETFFHIVFLLGLYLLRGLWLTHSSLRTTVSHSFKLMLSLSLGAGMSAILLLPFFRYLGLSSAWASRSAHPNEAHLSVWLFLLNFIPDYFGNQVWTEKFFLTTANYNESASGFVGITFLLLAFCASAGYYRDGLVRWFGIVALFSIAMVYKAPFLFDLITRMPGFDVSLNQRMLLLFGFSAVALGVIGLEKLQSEPLSRRKTVLSLSLLAGVLVILLLGSRTLTSTLVPASEREKWQIGFTGIFVLNLCISCFLIFRLPEKLRPTFLVLLVFFETGLHGLFYNSVTSEDNFYPSHEIVSYLTERFPEDYLRTFSYANMLPPNLGTWYGFNLISEYDAMGLESYQKLKKRIGPFSTGWEIFREQLNLNTLSFLGAKYLVLPEESGIHLIQKVPGKFKVRVRGKGAILLEQEALPRAYLLEAPDAIQLQEALARLMNDPKAVELAPVTSYRQEIDGRENVDFTASAPGFLVLNENYYPGMQALLDGRPVDVLDAHGLRALPVPAGIHRVVMLPEDSRFFLGKTISLAALLIWLLLFAVSWKKPQFWH